jgi:hypothetical protein
MDNTNYYSDMFDCNDGFLLEPRLQEYIKKKDYYKKNNIIPNVPAEHEFEITKEDIRRIKAFLKGDKDIYSNKDGKYKQDEYTDVVEMKGFENDPEEMYRNDPRFKRYQIKVKRDKNAMKMRYNYENIDNNNNYFDRILDDEYYDDVDSEYNKNKMNVNNDNSRAEIFDNYNYNNMDTNILQKPKKINKNKNDKTIFSGGFMERDNFEDEPDDLPDFLREYSRSYKGKYKDTCGDDRNYDRNIPIDSKMSRDYDNTNRYKYSNPYVAQNRRTYTNFPPTVQNNLRIHPLKNNRPHRDPSLHDPRIGAVIGELETYASKINKSYQYKSDMDNDSKTVIPNIACNGKKYINTSSYKAMPYMGKGEGVRDISIESEMLQGASSRTRRYSDDKTIDQMYLEQNSGLPCRGAKSYGYRNPIEHYFDYVSDDIQDPDHTVNERGRATRLDNHVTSRPKNLKYDIYH